MDHGEILKSLLSIEKEAAALVNDAQAEAVRRIAENENKNRSLYDEKFLKHAEKLESEFLAKKEQVSRQYKNEIEDYNKELSGIKTDIAGFSVLFNKLISGDG